MADYLVVNGTDDDVSIGTNATLDNDSSQGANAAMIFTARPEFDGVDGHAITVAYVAHTDNNAANPLVVTVTGTAIVVNPATDTDGSTILSTAAQVKTAIDANADAARLVSVANKAANDGTGVVSAFAATALSGGSGGTIPRLTQREMTLTDAEVVTALSSGVAIMLDTYGLVHPLRRAAARVMKYGKLRKL